MLPRAENPLSRHLKSPGQEPERQSCQDKLFKFNETFWDRKRKKKEFELHFRPLRAHSAVQGVAGAVSGGRGEQPALRRRHSQAVSFLLFIAIYRYSLLISFITEQAFLSAHGWRGLAERKGQRSRGDLVPRPWGVVQLQIRKIPCIP